MPLIRYGRRFGRVAVIAQCQSGPAAN